jgi:hypothetical protein
MDHLPLADTLGLGWHGAGWARWGVTQEPSQEGEVRVLACGAQGEEGHQDSSLFQ